MQLNFRMPVGNEGETIPRVGRHPVRANRMEEDGLAADVHGDDFLGDEVAPLERAHGGKEGNLDAIVDVHGGVHITMDLKTCPREGSARPQDELEDDRIDLPQELGVADEVPDVRLRVSAGVLRYSLQAAAGPRRRS